MPEVSVERTIPEQSYGQVIYAAAFIHPAIERVTGDGRTWRFELSEPVDRAVLTDGLDALAKRFEGIEDFTTEPVFSLELPANRDTGFLAELAARDVIQEIHPGLFVYREPVSTLIRFLDDAVVRRFARPFSAREECYPNSIPVADLAKAQHFSSFPEHLHFLTHLRQDLSVLDRFAGKARDKGADVTPQPAQLSAVQLVQNPSTCYHCYAARAGSQVEGNVAVTALTKCHRFEAANHQDFGRLLEFSLREVIFLGEPDYVRDCREETLELVESLATDWQIYGELSPSNDPFFTADFAAKAGQQIRMAMKFEFGAAIPGRDKRLAVMSSNLHGPTFSKSFKIRRPGGPLHTGCLGFGLERLALAILAQHGDRTSWPAKLAEDYAAWARTDPVGP